MIRSLLALALSAAIAPSAIAVSYTYEGELNDAGQAADGRYDLKLTVYSAAQGGHAVAQPIVLEDVSVREGRFAAALDLVQMNHPQGIGYIELAVRDGDSRGDFDPIPKRDAHDFSAKAICPLSWETFGNAGLAANNFVGTNDATPLSLRANGNEILRLLPGSPSGHSATFSTPNGVGINVSEPRATLDIRRGAVASTVPDGTTVQVEATSPRINLASPATQSSALTFSNGGLDPKAGIVFSDSSNRLSMGSYLRPVGVLTHDRYIDLDFVDEEVGVNELAVVNGGIHSVGGDVTFDSTGFWFDATNNRTGLGRVPLGNRLEVNGEASKTSAGDWLANSDARIKRDVAPIANAIDLLMRIRPVTFHYDDAYAQAHGIDNSIRYYNVVAQEFATVFPDAVRGSGEYVRGQAKTADNEILQVDTHPAAITAIAAIQELVIDNEAKAARIDELETRMQRLSDRLDALEQRRPTER